MTQDKKARTAMRFEVTLSVGNQAFVEEFGSDPNHVDNEVKDYLTETYLTELIREGWRTMPSVEGRVTVALKE